MHNPLTTRCNLCEDRFGRWRFTCPHCSAKREDHWLYMLGKLIRQLVFMAILWIFFVNVSETTERTPGIGISIIGGVVFVLWITFTALNAMGRKIEAHRAQVDFILQQQEKRIQNRDEAV
jgi:hypothetical protein